MPTTNKMPSLYIPHGGGPCFFMEWTMGPANTWFTMAKFLENLALSLPTKPEAIILISAHWEEKIVSILASAKPPLFYDYYGFPEHTYEIEYAAPGSPELAERIGKQLNDAGIETKIETKRGFDHGVFIPLKLVFPDADVPIVQISLKSGLDPLEHIKLGESLSSLRDEGVLIVGSGMSFHNIQQFFSSGSQSAEPSRAFDDWLNEAVLQTGSEKRNAMLTDWSQAPSAKFAHPREEHLIPLMVAAGAGQNDVGSRIFHDVLLNVPISGYRFG